MFGWHVHEKAILLAFIPLRYVVTLNPVIHILTLFHLFSLLITTNDNEAKQTLFLSIVANFSLFPLLFTTNLLVIKTSLFLLYTAIGISGIQALKLSKTHRFILSWHELLYTIGLVGVFMYEICLQYLLKLDKKLPFLPLLLMSIYCSIGITYFWLNYYFNFLLPNNVQQRKKIK